MTWLRVASCSWQAACGQRCDSGVPLWMCLWKAPTKSLPCSRRQTTTRPGLSKAAEVAALHSSGGLAFAPGVYSTSCIQMLAAPLPPPLTKSGPKCRQYKGQGLEQGGWAGQCVHLPFP
ncbi:g4895 [Coccomyxa viridis]|uniref:G4895 protein n=1 Tax=Coccomyxa viridis TaxID=1274662 RepID=A0ABP1FRF4_9CHLO